MNNQVLPIKEFATLRHKIWLRKTYGYSLDLEESAVLDQHHYTNIWRELDRNSIYLFNEIQGWAVADHFEYTFAQTVADTIRFRLFNKIETSQAMLQEFDTLENAFANPIRLYGFLSNRKANFTGAYVRCPDLSQLCHATSNKDLIPAAEAISRAIVLERDARKAWRLLRSIFSIGDFLADQLLMDLVWVGSALDAANNSVSNWFSPAMGPGAKAGLKYCEDTDQGNLKSLQSELSDAFDFLPMPMLFENTTRLKFDDRALEHTLCEYFKHVKFQNRGNSKVKMRTYKPATDYKVARLPFTWSDPQEVLL
jgi:hypothetical protein